MAPKLMFHTWQELLTGFKEITDGATGSVSMNEKGEIVAVRFATFFGIPIFLAAVWLVFKLPSTYPPFGDWIDAWERGCWPLQPRFTIKTEKRGEEVLQTSASISDFHLFHFFHPFGRHPYLGNGDNFGNRHE
ncbi:hypothetical protein [Geotalea toluenoxydans]|uniref:hypothetical protein n=1 Tax=Geotalea toluenoxydans TaxID=421624 RepID=UPI001FB4B2D1|nr:hypothetical protein [Geotalea toluenoxydans]